MLEHVSLNLECDMNVLVMRGFDWYIDTMEMHIWDACNVTNVTCDRLKAALSEWEVIALNIQPEGIRKGGGVQSRMSGQHMVSFGWLSPPLLSWVGNELSCCLVKHTSIHVTLDSVLAARDDLAPHLGHSALQPKSLYLCKLVDIDGYVSLLWLICVVLGIHIRARGAVQVFGQVTCTTEKLNLELENLQKKKKTKQKINKPSQNKTYVCETGHR